MVLNADPLVELPRLAKELNGDFVFASRHVADEETKQEQAVAQALDEQDCKLAFGVESHLIQATGSAFCFGRLTRHLHTIQKASGAFCKSRQSIG